MGVEMGLDVCLGGIAREVAQIQPGGRDFGHGEGWRRSLPDTRLEGGSRLEM
jgi:hypothetical protein